MRAYGSARPLLPQQLWGFDALQAPYPSVNIGFIRAIIESWTKVLESLCLVD